MKKIYALFMMLCLIISATAAPVVGTAKKSYPLHQPEVVKAKLAPSMHKAPAATQGLQYDAEAGELIRYYNETDQIAIDADYLSQGNLYVDIMAGDYSDYLSLLLFVQDTVEGAIIPEGTYPITSTPAYNTALASQGYSATQGVIPCAYYPLVEQAGQLYISTPMYFMQSGNIVVEHVNGNPKITINAVNSNNVPMTIVFEVGGKSEKVEVKAPLQYDATEADGALDYTFAEGATATATDKGFYGTYVVDAADASSELALLFIYPEGTADAETTIPAGTYTISDSQAPGTVMASSGVSSTGGVGYSFFANMDAEGYLEIPLYFLVSGTVEVTKVDGKLKVEVNGLNSNNIPVHVVYDATEPVVEEPEIEKPEPTYTENNLNPYAFGLESKLSDDKTTLTVTYRLNNSNATSVNVVIYNGEDIVASIPGTTTIGKNTVEVATGDLPGGVELKWAVEVNGTSVEAPTQETKMYNLYCPHGLAIDKDPESENFGRILVAEAMQGVPASGYVTSGKGAGLYVFNPSFTTDSTVYKGGNDFTRILASNGYQPWRVKISEDGRIFVSSLDLNGVVVWEVSKDLQTWTPVIAGTNDATDHNIYDADGNFVAGLNCSMDVIGSGEDLKLLLYSTNNKGIAFNQSGYRLDEYALGTATTWTGTPKNILEGGKLGLVHTNVEFIYDGEGGYWFGASRAGNAGQPNLVHINAAGEQDYYTEDASLYGGDGVLVHNGMLFKGKARTSSTVGNFGVWTIGKDADGKVTLTEKWAVAANGIGRNLNEFAVDFAENLYVVGNSGEKIIAYALPYSGQIETPAAAKYAFQLEAGNDTPDQGLTLTATGLETQLESDGSYTLQGNAVVNGDESNLMDFMLCVYPTDGYTDAFLNGWSVMIFGAPTPGAFVENEDGTFTYTAKIEDTYGDGTVYNINMSGTIKKNEGPEYTELEDQITNMTFDLENMVIYGGPSTNFEIEVVLGLGEDNFDGSFTLSDESSVVIKGIDAEFIEGYVYNIDPYAPSATAVVKVNWDDMYYEFTLTMSAAPAEATVVVVENATVEIEKYLLFGDTYDYALKMSGEWINPEDGLTYPVLVEVPVYYPEATEPFEMLSTVTVGGWGDNDPWLGFGEGTLTVTTVDGVVTATGRVENPMAGVVIDITISGTIIATSLEDATVTVKPVKMIQNGQLIIKKGDAQYNAQGATLK